MKPLKLRIKGLNSFIEQQEIDFGRLTEKGLFGIFGPTGSGKSTILDAITIALYGKIARESDEFINTECSELSLSYEFEIGSGAVKKRYAVDRNVKRDNKGRYKTSLARLIDREGDIVLAEATREVQGQIEKIIGLTCDDFTRSVVLPQGKFSEFLKLSGRDRRDMLERIFGLEKYGKKLGEKIKKARNKKLKEMNVLSGELKQFENVSKESYKAYKKELKRLIEEEKELRKLKKSLDEQYEKYKNIWELQLELEEYKKEKVMLDGQKEDIENKRLKYVKAQNALKVKPYMDSLKSTEEKLRDNEEKLSKAKEDLESINKKLLMTENKYKEIVQRKDAEIPELTVKEANLKQAIEIIAKIEVLEKERESLVSEFKKINKQAEEKKEEFKYISHNKEKAQRGLEEKISRMNLIKVEPEYREKVQSASLKEDEYNDLVLKLKDLEKKIKSKEDGIAKLSEQYDKALEAQNNSNNMLKLLEERKLELNKSFPGDNSSLLEKQNMLINIKKNLEEAIAGSEKKEELENRLKTLNLKIKTLEDRLNTVNESIKTKENEIRESDKEIKALERASLAGILAEQMKEGDKCPVCGSEHHPHKALKLEVKDLDEKKIKGEKYKEELQALNGEFRKIDLELAGFYKSRELIEEDIKTVLEKLSMLNKEKLQKEQELHEAEFLELKKKIEKWNNEKDETEKAISKCKDDKAIVEKAEAKLSESLRAEKQSIAELKEEDNKNKDKLNMIKAEYVALKEELGLDDIKSKLNELKRREREIQSLQKEEKKLRDEIAAYDKNREALNKLISELEVQVAKVIEIGKEKKNFIEDYKNQAAKLSYGEEPKSYLEKVMAEIKSIQKQEETLKLQLEEESSEKKQLENKILSGEQNNLTLNKLMAEQRKQLEDILTYCEFKDMEEAAASIMAEESIKNLEAFIKNYEDKVKDVLNNIIRIEGKLNEDRIEEEAWESIQRERNESALKLDNKLKDIAKCQQIIEVLEKELEKLKELLNIKKELEHRLSLLDDLDKLVQGNRFVEFVAMNQLRYIAMEASKRLKDITKGRYALELDSSGNFTMRDDFNGGVVRPTNTLSGGETFLTSLALALSLSSQIQLKGSAPLEFFFLDEGFGTLDSELLEVVMNSLERLHSQRLSVGIISHVEELKNRVPVKLIVEPALPGEGGSKVKIEYS